MIKRQDPFEGDFTPQDIRSLGGDEQPPAPKAKPAAKAVKKQPAPPAVPVQKNGITLTGEPADAVIINPQDNPVNEAVAEKHAVFAFGRFNPPTVGHEKLIHAVEDKAKEVGGKAHIVASHSQGTFKDPLPQDAKVGYLSHVAKKGSTVTGSSKEEPTFLQYAAKLHKQGVTDLHMVAGSDRVKEYEEKLNKYNGTHEGALFNFKHITVHSAGQRDPDAEGVEGMSGTKMRAAAREGDMEKFKSGLPDSLKKHAEHIADHIRAINEHTDPDQFLIEKVVSMTTRMHRAVAARKNKARLERAREIARRRLAKSSALSRRAMKRAKTILRTRLAGTAGKSYSNLTVSQKIAIDKMVERKKGAIKKIAQKIAPRIKGDEMRRLQAVTTGKKYSTSKLVVASYELIGNTITEKEQKSIMEKSQATGIDYSTLLSVFNRGKVAFAKAKVPPGKTPSQYAYDRLNSYIAGGKAFKEDVDLREQKTLRDVLASNVRTPRMMDTISPEHIRPIQPTMHHKSSMDGDTDIDKKRKRANVIRRKTQEYVHKVVEQKGVRDTVSPSLLESLRAVVSRCGCVPEEDYIYEEWTPEQWNTLTESEKENRPLNKPFRTSGGPKKFAVYVKNDKGNVIKLGFGDPNLEIKRDDPERRKAYRARHGCDNPGPRWKANWWSCNWSWSASKKVGA